MENHAKQMSPESQCPNTLTIAIDGPAGSGKSTVAKLVAQSLGYSYIDTGAMYRAVTWLILEENINPQDLEAIVDRVAKSKIELLPSEACNQRIKINGHDVTDKIRSPQVTRLVSPISAIPGVRQLLVEQQQAIAANGSTVMDGRDIGTVVLPKADLKVFLTASSEVRAERRYRELQEMGESVALEDLLQEIKERDRLDSTRAISPLRQAPDAIPINTDRLSIEEVVQRIINLATKSRHRI